MAAISTESVDAQGRCQQAEYRTKKFGSWERSQELDARVIAVGKEEGIGFAFDKIERTPNTLNAHRLIWLADKEGGQDAVVEALFRAYFTAGQDIGTQSMLLNVVSKAGLDRTKAEGVLTGSEGMETLKEAEALSRQHHVDGVPFFIINDQITLSDHNNRTLFWKRLGRRSPRCRNRIQPRSTITELGVPFGNHLSVTFRASK